MNSKLCYLFMIIFSVSLIICNLKNIQWNTVDKSSKPFLKKYKINDSNANKITGPIEYDNDRQLFYPWKEDPECKKYSTRFGKNLPLIYLSSFPRSGNTWTRSLIERGTGVFTASVYQEIRAMRRYGFYGESDTEINGTTLVAKTHAGRSVPYFENWINETIFPNKPVILLLRHPHNAITSFWTSISTEHFMEQSNKSDADIFNSKEFHYFVNVKLNVWRNLIQDILIWVDDLLIVYYNDLIKNEISELQRILNFIGVTPDKGRLNCIRKHPSLTFKNTRKRYDPFTQEEKRNMNDTIQEINELLEMRHYSLISSDVH